MFAKFVLTMEPKGFNIFHYFCCSGLLRLHRLRKVSAVHRRLHPQWGASVLWEHSHHNKYNISTVNVVPVRECSHEKAISYFASTPSQILTFCKLLLNANSNNAYKGESIHKDNKVKCVIYLVNSLKALKYFSCFKCSENTCKKSTFGWEYAMRA